MYQTYEKEQETLSSHVKQYKDISIKVNFETDIVVHWTNSQTKYVV